MGWTSDQQTLGFRQEAQEEMSMADSIEVGQTAAKAEALRNLHAGPGMLVLPNAWDAASARIVEKAGFPAIATTSAGVALALGYADGQKAPIEEMLAAASRIVRSVALPVTVDFEAGYGLAPSEIVERLAGIGAAGLNFEDTDHVAGGLVDAGMQAGQVAALVEAGRAAGVPLVVNARVDVFIHRQGTPEEQAEEGLRRARLYHEAGADCIYPILLGDATVIRRFVDAVRAINVNLRPGGPMSLQDAAELGVRRVSYAGSLFRETTLLLERLSGELKSEVDALNA
jgi:2-methylisocitrate lyase-like PEP mutase family enzyme